MGRTLTSVLVAMTVGLVIFATAAMAEKRVALVVGNSAYKNESLSLSNPSNDAADVADALRGLDFEVIDIVNANKRDMDMALAKFARAAAGADLALFYYAGHGLQYQGRNYLMPTDAELEDDVSLRYAMTSLDDVRDAIDRASGVKVMILDACRNNPLADRLQKFGGARSAGGSRGLAPADKTQGSITVYATAADQVAQDGVGRNSPFTTALLKRLREPGLEIELMFRRVSADVVAATNGRQRPESFISLQSEYYLNQTDIAAWEKIKDREDAAALRDFIEKFPSSRQVQRARERLDQIQRARRDVVAAAPPAPVAPPRVDPKPPVGTDNARTPPVASPAPAGGGQVAAAAGVIHFSDPLTMGAFPVLGQSIERLASSLPEFSPIEGLDEKQWKHDCAMCHKWTQQTLCAQGRTYAGNPAAALRNRHPYGGAFKVALMEWAKTGCQ